MSNIIDLLLNADLEQIERPSKEVEIKRLSNHQPPNKGKLTIRWLHWRCLPNI